MLTYWTAKAELSDLLKNANTPEQVERCALLSCALNAAPCDLPEGSTEHAAHAAARADIAASEAAALKMRETFRDIHAVVEHYKRNSGGHFFDPDTMRYFRCRLTSAMTYTPSRVYFVTSEKRTGWGSVPDARRVWTVRTYEPVTCVIDTVGGFGAHKSLNAARNAMYRAAEADTREPLNREAIIAAAREKFPGCYVSPDADISDNGDGSFCVSLRAVVRPGQAPDVVCGEKCPDPSARGATCERVKGHSGHHMTPESVRGQLVRWA